MNDDLHAALTAIVERVSISAPDRFAFGADEIAVPADLPGHAFPTAQPRVTLLRDLLYSRAFIQPLDATPPDTPPIADFAVRLSRANRGVDRWHEGWRVARVLGNGQLRAARFGRERTLWPGEYLLTGGAATAPRPEAPVALWQPRESHAAQPGFYFAFGQALADEADESTLLRLYWNVTATGALALLDALTPRLNRFGLPFRFKCLNLPEAYVRLDAAVLYVARRHHRLVLDLVDDIVPALGAGLGTATPLFTRRVRPGVALAEDPPGGESFGMNRCRLLAEALWAAFDEGLTDTTARLARIARQFAQYGVSLAAPHLQAGSTFNYVNDEEALS